MICAINTIEAQITTKNIKITAQNITHWSQWEITEDFEVLFTLNISFHTSQSFTP